MHRIRGRVRAAKLLAIHGRPSRVLLFGPLSLGDDLLCTTVLREARTRGTPFAMMTARPELFEGNADPARLLPVDAYYANLLRRLGSRVIQPYYVRQSPANPYADLLPPRHITAEMCRLAGLTGVITARPYFSVRPSEQEEARRFKGFVAVQSSGMAARLPYETKEWPPQKFAAVIERLRSQCSFVQLGSASDAPLPVDVDLRGQTTLRQAAAILQTCSLFVGLEGFLTHLARAVDCPAVVVHGGRAFPGVFGYCANINLHSSPECSPCGLRSHCPENMRCMNAISVDDVVNAIVELRRQHPTVPLAVETVMVT